MSSKEQEIIKLVEHRESELIPLSQISMDLGKNLIETFGNRIKIEFSILNEGWKIKPKGWVGFIALTKNLAIQISPKVSISNLFNMMEYVYGFKEIKIDFQDKFELVRCDSIVTFYDRFALLLACRILHRAKKGFYQSYVEKTESLLCVRGRIDIRSSLKTLGNLRLNCKYREFTGHIIDNNILAWTLYVITRSGACNRSLPEVGRALQSLRGVVEMRPCSPSDCINRQYNRLNEDYQAIHSLCRFFLESRGASFNHGEYSIPSFLINMDKLFEDFLASWIKIHLPNSYLECQEPFSISSSGTSSRIDLVLYDKKNGSAHSVMDTKYKKKFDPQDFYQIITYALVKNCSKAFLIYPEIPENCPEELFPVQGISVKILIFSLKDDLEIAGQRFKYELLKD
jgi:5-methylcytosine-specific restriction enzyme subunit McrC